MDQSSRFGKELDENRLPEHVHSSVVRALYADNQSLFLGILCLVAAPLILHLKNQETIQLVFAVLFLLAGTGRLILAQAFNDSVSDTTSVEQYRVWEHRYFISGCIYFGIIGAWLFVGTMSQDPFALLLSVCVTLSFMFGIIGRNFANAKLVSAQVLIMAVLVVAGFLYRGGMYDVLLAMFLVPFFLTIRKMTTRLRKILFASELAAEASRTLANRLNIALDNMMHGIAMFDEDGCIVVANERFVELAKVSGWEVTDSGLYEDDAELPITREGKSLRRNLQECLKVGQSARFRFDAGKHRTLEADYNSMSGGGVVVVSDVSERVKAERVIRDLANFDPLTELPNRRFFVEKMNELLTENGQLRECAMFFLDLDKFKEVNDTLGHSVGDQLLRVVAGRLKRLATEGSLICRFGGDEFVIVVPGMNRRPACVAFAEEIITELQAAIVVEPHTLNIAASVGIALSPENGKTAEELLQNTDSALYEAKASGRSTYVFYSDDLGEAIRLRSQLEKDLHIALKEDQIQVYFQPLVNLKRGRITTCEALSRWEHPTLGRISPETFITIAEEGGLISDLGHHVLRKAMLICKNWPEHIRVAVNVSSIQFKKQDFCDGVEKLLAETGLPAHRLELEITESMMLDNITEATRILHRLSEIGIRISLDDFGTGFSSLSYLHNLPFDKVKIDRSFVEHSVAEERGLILLKGIVDLLKKLGFSIVLEGIESEKQMEVLFRNVEVNEVQGFLFSRPLPEKDISTLLHESNPEGRSGSKEEVA